MHLRAANADEFHEIAKLIHASTNAWYQKNGKPAIFSAGPESCLLFCQVYEDLDPGCCMVAEDESSRRLMGSCFHHPRETHVSLGIMNVHPDFFGRGVASRLLRFITGFADAEGKPVRLVSSAMNLDSFSLYTRAGFVPRAAFQDMMIPVPAEGLKHAAPGAERVRPATAADVPEMVALEQQISGIRREKDYRYFLENRLGIWHTSVIEGVDGGIDGFLCSVAHPASTMLGPGVMRTDKDAAALILAELNVRRGLSPVFLAPVDRPELVQILYSWGGHNCEIHFAQVRGDFQPSSGIAMPTFMPETG
jgi:ribosomal protein S18 acetylase RimI-like enzyme